MQLVQNEAKLDEVPTTSRSPTLLPWEGFNRAQTAYLNMVRGIAAQLVLFQHCVDDFLKIPMPGQFGNLGVVIFFLISGFLIVDSIRARVNAGRFSLSEFMVSRFTRIFMPYLPAILLVAVLDHFSAKSTLYQYHTDFNLRTAVANVFMLQDFSAFQLLRRLHVHERLWFVREFGSARQFWTISIEWWIYVAVGVGTTIILHHGRHRVLTVLLCFSAIEPLYNLIGGPGNSLTGFWILGGVASAIYRHYHNSKIVSSNLWGIVGASLAGLASLRLLYTNFQIYDIGFVTLFGALLFLPVLAYRKTAGKSIAHYLGLDRLAFHSYSLYLTHASIVVLIGIGANGHLTGWTELVLSVIVSNLIAIPFAFAFEWPQKQVRAAILRRLS